MEVTGVARFRFAVIEDMVGPKPSLWHENYELEITRVRSGVVTPFLKDIIEPRDFALTESRFEEAIVTESFEVEVEENISPPSPSVDSTLSAFMVSKTTLWSSPLR